MLSCGREGGWVCVTQNNGVRSDHGLGGEGKVPYHNLAKPELSQMHWGPAPAGRLCQA